MIRRPHPLKRLADVFVFAPLGFLVEAPRLLPELAETGRQSLCRVRTSVRSRTEQATSGLAATARPTARTYDGGGREDLIDPHEEIVIAVEREDEPAGDELPIPGYDQLAASQVIARLSGLSPTELDRIEAHEVAHRHRRTVLAKISQLRA
jgi:hypothetical protein